MKVALVHDFLIKKGGAERVLSQFMELFPDAPVFSLVYDEHSMGDFVPKEKRRITFLQRKYSFWKAFPIVGKLAQRMLLKHIPRAVESWDLMEYDLILSSSTAWCHGALTSASSTHICYCHSPMRFAWDYTNEYAKQLGMNTEWGKVFLSRSLKYIRAWDQIAADRPDMYLANSHHIQRRISKYFGQDSQVLYPPVDVDRFAPRATKKDYFLIVSTLTAYKKIELAIDVFNKIDRPLIIVGDGPHKRKLQAMAADNITFKGFLPDEEIDMLMEEARAFIFPAEDDFGITPVEAMAAGTPVLAYGKGGARETVIPGVTGAFFNEPTAESLENGLARLLAGEEVFNAHTISEHAKKFSQKRFQQELRRIIKPFAPLV